MELDNPWSSSEALPPVKTQPLHSQTPEVPEEPETNENSHLLPPSNQPPLSTKWTNLLSILNTQTLLHRRNKVKSGVYDDQETETHHQDLEGNGLRVWYQDYTTIGIPPPLVHPLYIFIDWIHDNIKDKHRIRSLRTLPGLSGWCKNTLDASQAWILVFLIGISCGCIASGIDILLNWASDLKTGVCVRDWRLNKRFCCNGTVSFFEPCEDWRHWSGSRDHWIDYIAFILFGMVFALISVMLVSFHSSISTSTENQVGIKYHCAGTPSFLF